MSRVETIRAELKNRIRAVPFQPFALRMENGERVMIEHPENVAFDPEPVDAADASEEFYVVTSKRRMFSTFGAVTSVVTQDRGDD